MDKLFVKKDCSRCLGTGTEVGVLEPTDCPACGGDGVIVTAEFIDITDLHSDVTKCLRMLKKLLDNHKIAE